MTSDLSFFLAAGACLIESGENSTTSDLKSVLVSRLDRHYVRLGLPRNIAYETLEEAQLATAREALHVVEEVQKIIGRDGDPDDIPVIGTRDLAELRTLLSITFNWGVEPLLGRVSLAWPSKNIVQTGQKVVVVTVNSEDYSLLCSLVSRLMSLVFPGGTQGNVPQTLITTTLLHRHITDLLRPCIALGWLPKPLSSETMSPVDPIRLVAMRLLALCVAWTYMCRQLINLFF